MGKSCNSLQKYSPYTDWMSADINIIRRVLLDVLHVILGHVLRTDGVLDVLRRKHVAVRAENHPVGVDSLVPSHVDGQGVVSQRLHLVRREVSVSLVAQDRILS